MLTSWEGQEGPVHADFSSDVCDVDVYCFVLHSGRGGSEKLLVRPLLVLLFQDNNLEPFKSRPNGEFHGKKLESPQGQCHKYKWDDKRKELQDW